MPDFSGEYTCVNCGSVLTDQVVEGEHALRACEHAWTTGRGDNYRISITNKGEMNVRYPRIATTP
jgi:transcription initiation factor TFIIIB Brf1 subunit/transcription initiation factor TFIIB